MICPVCKKEKRIAPMCNRCLECSIDEAKKMFAENPELKDTFREAVQSAKEQIPQIVDDTVEFYNALTKTQGVNNP